MFAPDGNFLFTGARADPELWCWDVRYQSGVLYKLHRDTPTTNQRIGFDIEPCGQHLASGTDSPSFMRCSGLLEHPLLLMAMHEAS